MGARRRNQNVERVNCRANRPDRPLELCWYPGAIDGDCTAAICRRRQVIREISSEVVAARGGV